MQPQCVDMIPFGHRIAQQGGGTRDSGRRGGDDPRCAEAERRIHQRIHCAVDPAVLRRVDHEVGEKLQVTRALLDAHDSRHFIHESDGQFRREIAPVHHVVDNQRHAGLFVDHAEVLDHHLVIRAEEIMHRRYLDGIDAETFDRFD